MVVNRDGIGDWERFRLTKLSDGSFVIQTFTNNYLSLEKEGTLRSIDKAPTNQSGFIFETPLYY
jgi:hypothetical protein